MVHFSKNRGRNVSPEGIHTNGVHACVSFSSTGAIFASGQLMLPH